MVTVTTGRPTYRLTERHPSQERAPMRLPVAIEPIHCFRKEDVVIAYSDAVH